MRNLIDRYVYDVVRRLPEAERADVERELRANIADMLSDDPEEAAVIRVLESLGEPRKLADQYRPNRRYLISPAMFDHYVAALRIILPIAGVLAGALALIFDLLETPAPTVAGVVGSALTSGLSAAFSALIGITLGFIVADYLRFQKPAGKWSPDELPNLPPEASVRIPRGETIANMAFSVLFIALTFAVIRNPQILAWYGAATERVPLFLPEALSRFVPWLVLISALSLGVSCYMLVLGRWTYPLAILNGVYGLVCMTALVAFVRGTDAVNPAIGVKLQEFLPVTAEELSRYVRIGVNAAAALIMLFTAIDIVNGLRKAHKARAVRAG